MSGGRAAYSLRISCVVAAVATLSTIAAAVAEVRIVGLGNSGIRGKGVPESEAYQRRVLLVGRLQVRELCELPLLAAVVLFPHSLTTARRTRY
jgi:hypothetical protein